MFPFSALFRKNQMGFNPFAIQSQMMKHPMAGGQFPFNMMKQNPTGGGGQSFPFSMMGGSGQSFPFNMMKQGPMGGGGQSFPFSMMGNQFPFNMAKQNPPSGGGSNSPNMNSSFPFNMLNQNPMGFPFNYENQPVQEENPFTNSFFQPQQGQMQQNPGQMQQQAPQFPHSLIRDQSGKLDFNKIGNGVQSTLGLVGQMGPLMKMFGGFFR
ncbi:hypothetical protein DS745_06680 [Anaerobacillus alkaliphilus]|uniref:Uncharacterized protein n=1 Tax=Anaerobacillus alkaliphilus TaxID=1548597 RepID=A0A4Q0VXG0_9BACI|nr:hypothetical protein [Anaerobacillus alkaliphilus]RXJ02384.1 hypothetical protein DS745_06680 [Anaerobacillus alkaliphilus]